MERDDEDRPYWRDWYMDYVKIIGCFECIICLAVLWTITLQFMDLRAECATPCLYLGINIMQFDIYYDNGNMTWLCDPDLDIQDKAIAFKKHERFDSYYNLCFGLAVSLLFTSTLLILGTLMLNKWLTVPYIMCRWFIAALQVCCLVKFHFMMDARPKNVASYALIVWTLTALFTFVVFYAVYRWERRERRRLRRSLWRRRRHSDSESQPGPSGLPRPILDTESQKRSPPSEEEEEIEGVELRRRFSAVQNPGPVEEPEAAQAEVSASGTENDVVDEKTPLIGH